MEITDKDVELIDNYLDGALSREEEALFHIRMQDEEFAGFVKFQRHLRDEIYPEVEGQRSHHSIGYDVNLNKRARVAAQLGSRMWFVITSTMIVAALLAAILLR